MARMSRKMKDAIQTTTFLVVVVALVLVYVVYPLIGAKMLMGRSDFDEYDLDSLGANVAPAWEEAGLAVDTFSVETDGLTTLACLYVAPTLDSAGTPGGTVLLVHDEDSDRDEMLPMAHICLDAGLAVVAIDQRAAGLSTGLYHGEGQNEGNDIVEVVRHLDLRDKVVHPLVVVGWSLGGDGALLAAREEGRIDAVVAVEPFLTTSRMLTVLKERHDMYWFPFFRTMMWWWYGIRSGYAAPYRDLEDIKPVGCRTLILATPDTRSSEEMTRLMELSDPDLLTVDQRPADDEELGRTLSGLVAALR